MTIWRGADGEIYLDVVDGRSKEEVARAGLALMKRPGKLIGSKLILHDGSEVALPFSSSSWILPDKSGVAVVFEPGQYVKEDGSDYFPYPNNAAFFNADGSLRFQVELPGGHHIDSFFTTSMAPKFTNHVGFLVCRTAGAPPDYAYAVDPNNPSRPQLEPGHWVRY